MPLTPEQIEELLEYSKKGRRPKPRVNRIESSPGNWQDVEIICDLPCPTCGVLRDENGYCINKDCAVDSVDTLYECCICGYCATPERCVASVECPYCLSPVGDMCTNPDIRGRLEVYHEARWDLVQALYGTHYLGNDNLGVSQRAVELLT